MISKQTLGASELSARKILSRSIRENRLWAIRQSSRREPDWEKPDCSGTAVNTRFSPARADTRISHPREICKSNCCGFWRVVMDMSVTNAFCRDQAWSTCMSFCAEKAVGTLRTLGRKRQLSQFHMRL